MQWWQPRGRRERDAGRAGAGLAGIALLSLVLACAPVVVYAGAGGGCLKGVKADGPPRAREAACGAGHPSWSAKPYTAGAEFMYNYTEAQHKLLCSEKMESLPCSVSLPRMFGNGNGPLDAGLGESAVSRDLEADLFWKNFADDVGVFIC